MTSTLPQNATILDILSTHYRAADFTANILAIMRRAERERGPVVVKLGVTGAGKLPNFRIDSLEGDWSLGAFDGVSYQPFETGSEKDNWSSKGMDFKEVEELLRKLRNFKR